MRWTLALCLLYTGCSAPKEPRASEEVRELAPPGPSSGELFEGQIRVHTRGTQGDALGCSVSPLGELIAFSWNNHQVDPKVYVIPAAGGAPTQLTFGAWVDLDPEFVPATDPSNYKVAFASKREGNFDIYMITLSGSGGAWQLTSDGADEMHPTFSPNGRDLAFARMDRDGTWRIWRKDLSTQQEIHLGPGSNPAWSPTGTTIAFQLPSGRTPALYSLWTMHADGTERTQLVDGDSFGAVHPAWSPDGRYIAFAKIPQKPVTSYPSGDILIVDTLSGALFRLTATECFNTDPCWGLDGWICFSSTRTTGRFNVLSGKLIPGLAGADLAEDKRMGGRQ